VRASRQPSTSDAEDQQGLGTAQLRLLAEALESQNLDELLEKLAQLFAHVVPAHIAVIWLRDDDQLRAKAAFGLEREDIVRAPALRLEQVLAGLPRGPGKETLDAVTGSAEASHRWIGKPLRSVHRLHLWHGSELVAAVDHGSLGEHPPTSHPSLLDMVARLATSAIVRMSAQHALERAVRSRDDALSVVAHDLRNPINVISLAANSLLKRVGDSAMRRSIDRISRAVHRADRLIGDLLDINAIEGGRFSVDARPIETADFILAVLDSQQSLAANASVIMASDLSPDLPKVLGDEERLLEVLENLVGNAVKFTGHGGQVTVGAAPIENGVKVWVKDNGAGIPPEQLPHLFDRFWQAQKADRRGTGLGLTICKGIVEAHGGRIWAETAVGQGTTVCFTLPSASTRLVDDEPRPVANILMVDDRPENLLSLRAILERPEYSLISASSGEEALRFALRTQFDVALIDIAMPTMSGLEVAVHLKQLERSRETPIIFITAFGQDPEEIHRAYAAGGADYLVKPLDAEIVRKKVAVFVALSRSRRRAERSPGLPFSHS